MDNFFTFDGKSCLDFGVVATGSGTYNRPRRRVEHIEVPGRNGTLTVTDGTYENVTLWYDCYAFKNFPDKIDALAAWLLSKPGYIRLEDTYHPDYYRMAEFAGPIEATPTTLMRSGRFRLEFNCKPEKYLKSGQHFADIESSVMFNPTLFPAKPVFRVTGPGGRRLTVNGVTIDVGRHPGGTLYAYQYVDLDCEEEEASGIATDGQPLESDSISRMVILHNNKFPVLQPGENTVEAYTLNSDGTTESNLSEFQMMGRWWTV